MLIEKGYQLIKRNQAHPIVQIDMSGVRNNIEFPGLGCPLISIFAEFLRVYIVTRDEQHETRRNRLNVIERVKIHEFDVTGQRRMRCQLRRGTFGDVFASGSAVEVIKLPLNSGRVLSQ
jgi:hypothetical protein